MRDDLGNRMKGYEVVKKHSLESNTPVIARFDGKAFHTFTKGLERPWDLRFQKSMWDAAKYVAERVQGCKVAYVQSDEISLLLTNYEKEATQGWFGYKLEKMVSVGASMVTGGFIASASGHLPERLNGFLDGSGLPAFDARFFNLPKHEVNNYFVWRQNDAIRNSIQSLARTYFSHADCNNKSQIALKAMLLEEKGIEWEEQRHWCKQGLCIVKRTRPKTIEFHDRKSGGTKKITVERNVWERDLEIPLFWHDKSYIERYL